MPIQVLSEDIANKIAAGEVVERPASVVKELVENSLDAGSTSVRIELMDGGKRLVRVLDDGCGMTPADAELSLRRHATSKLASAEDLATIATLGFRGEALPSIASVSQLELVTRTADEVEGTRIIVEGGHVREATPIGCPEGTQVRVAELFYNMPARRKFLKTETTELNQIVNHVQWAALAHYGVRLTLVHGDRTLIDVPVCQSRRERLRLLYGKEFTDHLIDFTKTFENFEIECFIGDASLSKANRTYQLLFVNDRPIRDRTVSAALTQALREVIPPGRHAVAFLFMRLPAEDVDVNVHPAKAEVRFKHDRGIFRSVVQAISQGISEHKFIPDVDTAPAGSEPGQGVQADSAGSGGPTPATRLYPVPEHRNIIPPSRTRYDGSGRAEAPTDQPAPHPHERVVVPGPVSDGWAELNRRPEYVQRDLTQGGPDPGDAIDVELLDFTELALVGSLFDTYIVVADGENAYVIDQHVASERIHYERILTQLLEQKVESQGLLTPISVELSAPQKVKFDAHAVWFEKFGIYAEEFGGPTILLRSLPASLQVPQAAQAFRDLLDGLEEDWAPERSWELIQERAAATLACHSAVRAGDRLADEAQTALLRDLSQVHMPYNCPHGRPVIIRMRRSELESRFHRR